MQAIEEQTEKAKELYTNLIMNTKRSFSDFNREFNQEIKKPNFI